MIKEEALNYLKRLVKQGRTEQGIIDKMTDKELIEYAKSWVRSTKIEREVESKLNS